MGRRIGSGGRSFGGSGFKGTRSGGFRSSGGFKARTSYNYGGYRRHYRPYRRNYIFHSLGPVGKVVYIIIMIILILISASL